MGKICKKCGYERKGTDKAPDYECPKCGAVYAKVEARIKYDAEAPLRQKEQEEKKRRETEELRERDKARKLKSQFVCTECGHLGNRITITKGSLFIEIILWLAFLIPGLIYSIWRHTSRFKACPKCRHESMIPATSPKGQKLVAELEP